MSVRQGLLAVLELGPNYGYQLRAEFEHRTGGTWQVNIGQVYTTLDRLERDGLVRRGDSTDEGQVLYEITDAGRAATASWLAQPVARERATRDELAIKLAIAVTLPGIDIAALVQTQRVATLGALQDLTRLKMSDDGHDLAWELVLESIIFQLEAEVRWLDHAEARLARVHRESRRVAPSAEPGNPRRSAPSAEPGNPRRSAPPAEPGNPRWLSSPRSGRIETTTEPETERTR